MYSLAGLVSGSFRNSSKGMDLDGDCTIGVSLWQEMDGFCSNSRRSVHPLVGLQIPDILVA
jgi:hypothetical protein